MCARCWAAWTAVLRYDYEPVFRPALDVLEALAAAEINERLVFPPFSNDGEYLKVYFMEDLSSRTGSPRDDGDNLFTTRMLLMLESQPDCTETHLPQASPYDPGPLLPRPERHESIPTDLPSQRLAALLANDVPQLRGAST